MYANNDHKQFFLLPHGGAVADNHFKPMSVFILIWSHNMWSFIHVKQCEFMRHFPFTCDLVKFTATPFSYFTTYQKIHVDLTSVPSWHHLYQISSKSNVQCICSTFQSTSFCYHMVALCQTAICLTWYKITCEISLVSSAASWIGDIF